MILLLDTCALIWWTLDPNRLSLESIRLLDNNRSLLLSSISLWEIGIKIKNKKIDIGMDIQSYLNHLKKLGSIEIIPVDEQIWIKNLMLNWPHRDPSDRTIVSTAMLYNATIVTQDEVIKNFYSKVIG